MSTAGDLVQEAFRIEERGIDWRAAIAGALAAIGPLAVGLALDETVAGLTAAIGGLNTALCTPRAALRGRVWWTALAALGGVVSLVLADIARDQTWSAVAVTFTWCGGLAFLRAAGRAGALVGFATGAVFTILVGIPTGPAPIGQQMLWYALGAVPALAIMVWARRPGHGAAAGAGASGGGGASAAAPLAVGADHAASLARGTVRAVRAGVLHDAGLRAHALRLGAAVAAGTLIYRLIDLPHGYWVALTTLAILQPGEHATRVRAIQRAAGTLAGAALIVLVTLVTDERWALVACAAACAFWLYALDERGYFWLVVMLTPTALLMLAVVDFQGDDVVLERVGNSTLGILIGLALGEAAWRVTAPRPNRDGDD